MPIPNNDETYFNKFPIFSDNKTLMAFEIIEYEKHEQ